MQNDRSFVSGLGFPLSACTPHCFLAATSSFNHRRELQTTQTSRWHFLLAECVHRGHESREGSDHHDTAKAVLDAASILPTIRYVFPYSATTSLGMNGKKMDNPSQFM